LKISGFVYYSLQWWQPSCSGCSEMLHPKIFCYTRKISSLYPEKVCYTRKKNMNGLLHPKSFWQRIAWQTQECETYIIETPIIRTFPNLNKILQFQFILILAYNIISPPPNFHSFIKHNYLYNSNFITFNLFNLNPVTFSFYNSNFCNISTA